jgi:hypothetical protein
MAVDAAVGTPFASDASAIVAILNIAPTPFKPILNLTGIPVKLVFEPVPPTVQSVHKRTRRLHHDTLFHTVNSVAACFG